MRLFLIAAFCLACTPALAEVLLDPGQTTQITPNGNGGYQVYTPPRLIYVPPPQPRQEWDYSAHPNGPFAPAQVFGR